MRRCGLSGAAPGRRGNVSFSRRSWSRGVSQLFRRGRLKHIGKPIIELALALERGELVVAADVAVVDEDLRNGAKAACALDHLDARGRIETHVDLLIVEAFGAQQIPCRPAIAAELGGVEENAGHPSVASRSSNNSSTVTGRLTGSAQALFDSKVGRRS